MSDPSEVLIYTNQSSSKGYFCCNPSLFIRQPVKAPHFARYYLDNGLLVGRAIHGVPWNTTCHVPWNDEVRGPALEWCLDWLGGSERLNQCWLTHDCDAQPEFHIP
ncbi:MAG: hypothetical protein B0D91_11940 [Oceanospirillales bacterium LUC14_002_19_P2]|nr:MAG: hypothetical protein B0D91_11940 [Oceanospirillales bacterium LUC14_002_19_P2]